MAVPDFQSIMLPLLEVTADGKERRHVDLLPGLVQRFQLTDEDLSELLPSGHSTFENRVRWAKWYLTRAGLLEATARGVFRISAAGKRQLEAKPPSLNIAALKQSRSGGPLRVSRNSHSRRRTKFSCPPSRS